ncbi:MAG: SH3 domain-containing protein [Acetatifactor sp.]
MKDRIRKLMDYMIRKSKVVFPVIVIAAVAVTVLVALNAKGAKAEQVEKLAGETETEEPKLATAQALEPIYEEIPLVANEDSAIYTVIATYYNAMALGDMDTLLSLCDVITDDEMIRFEETAKYLESYPVLEVYTKPGYEEGSTIAYVYYRVVFTGKEAEYPGYQVLYISTNEQGELYIKRNDFTEEMNEYIKAVSTQADVVEFNNRVTVEYNELLIAQPDLWEYLDELNKEIAKATGVVLAQQVAGEAVTDNGEGTGNPDDAEGAGEMPEEGQEPSSQEQTTEPQVLYATATTTVNVRSSDSENADKLGKVSGGTKLQVLEQRVNGWTKVLYQGKDGFIKTEYLQMAENAADAEVIGTVTATTNINVRASGSQSADRLGVLAGGETVELIAKENGWCKIIYNGQIGYVKADYVE